MGVTTPFIDVYRGYNPSDPFIRPSIGFIPIITLSPHLKMDDWKTILSFWGPRPVFRGELAVSFRECIPQMIPQKVHQNVGKYTSPMNPMGYTDLRRGDYILPKNHKGSM